MLRLRRCEPLHRLQCRAEGDVEGHGVLGPLGALRQRRQ